MLYNIGFRYLINQRTFSSIMGSIWLFLQLHFRIFKIWIFMKQNRVSFRTINIIGIILYKMISFKVRVLNNCCSTVILVRYLLSFLSIGKVIVAKFYPFFRVFRVRGPFITSRTIVREVMMGPRTRNTRKNG